MYPEVEQQKKKNGEIHFRVKICENVRVNGKPRKKFIRSVGTAKNERELEDFKRLASKIIDQEIAARNRSETLFDPSDCLDESEQCLNVDYRKLREESRVNEGNKEVFGTLFDDSGFGSVLEGRQSEILKEVVIARIEEPASKRKTQEILERDCGFNTSLDSIYRMMTALSRRTGYVLNQTLNSTRTLFEDKVDVVFFDVTTLYFESVIEDELRQFGFSKDSKFHQTQVVLALAVTSGGLPIAYKVFPGNTAETKTLIECLHAWKVHVPIGRVVFVADRGLFQAANLKMLEDSGYEFIVAATLRRMTKDIQAKVLDKSTFRQISGNSAENAIFTKTFEHGLAFKKEKELLSVNGRLIVTLSSERASKDKKDRDRILEKMKKVLGKEKADASKLISNHGYLKYAKFEGKKVTSVDSDRVAKDEQWDGIHGVFTNANLSDEEVLVKYKELWLVEQAFRISKSDLEMRPIFHFTKPRIEAHIAICFMALHIMRKAQLLLERAQIQISSERLREELGRVQSTILYDKNRGIRFKVPSNMNNVTKAIYEAIGLKRRLSVRKI